MLFPNPANLLMKRRTKDPLLLPYTNTRSRNIVGLLLALTHLQYYQRYDSMILKIWVKSKFVLWQPRYFMPVIFEIKMVSLKNSCVSDIHPILDGLVYTGCYICNSLVHLIYINYLSACNKGMLKRYYCYVLVLPFENSFNYYEKYF